MSEEDQACEVPLVERLRSVPEDYRTVRAIQWADDGRETGHQFIPVGFLMHRAAAEIERLQNDVSKAMANHSADLNGTPSPEAGTTAALSAKLNELDAARYRWLRQERDEQQPVVTQATFSDWGKPWRDVPLWGDELDAAVDKAMASEPPRPQSERTKFNEQGMAHKPEPE